MSATEDPPDGTREQSTEKNRPGSAPKLLPNGHLSIKDTQTENLRLDEKTKTSVAIQHNAAGRPKIVAKGSGELAEQILQIAFAQGIKVRTDSDLVEILSTVDIESEIPLEALTAVATILNYVYNEQKHQHEKSVPPE
ncbi:EscU/YscU/HrcU family type III secretion system export apparatus switch protein [Kiloniella laminariae]|uniref:EscU/YscU/HrcU family type III secretion system export apparatus switch protein n=1 Tax=Kiloniella laminariae TaxID=454162 RepID=UPI00035FDFCD|nr:EscU/YscU/HrcU family type III secretion system export apparatus switch protein [Kiloniella laminariae]